MGGEEAGHAAAAWYFFKGSIGNKRYMEFILYQHSATPVAVDAVSIFFITAAPLLGATLKQPLDSL